MLSRLGFTLVEILVALVIAGLIAAVLVPEMLGRLAEAEGDTLATNLSGLSGAVTAYRVDVGRYPRRMTQLSTPLTAGAQDLCTVAVPNVALWKGPYTDRSMSVNGLASGSAVITDTLTRNPASGVFTTGVADLVFTVREVDQTAALDVDAVFDGDGNLGTGAVQWTVGAVPGRGSMTYSVPIRGC